MPVQNPDPITQPMPQKFNLINKFKALPRKRKIILIGSIASVIVVLIVVALVLFVSSLLRSNLYEQNVSYPISTPQDITQTTVINSNDNLNINFTDPVLTESKVLFTVNKNSVNYESFKNYVKDANYKIYNAGTVKSGSFNDINLTGFKYYVAVWDTAPKYGYMGSGDYPALYIRYLVGPNKNIFYALGKYDINTNPNDKYAAYISTFKFTEIIGLVKFDEMKYDELIKSDGGNTYNISWFGGIPFKEMNGSRIDTLKDTEGSKEIYLSKDDKKIIYIKSIDGFIYYLQYYPSLINPVDRNSIYDPIPEVTWSNGSKNSSVYDYISIGGCSGGLTGIEIVDVSITDLKVIGKDKNGNNVFEYADANNAYLQKLYNQDYVDSEMNKYNKIKSDDTIPLSYPAFLGAHPHFIWQDPFGRYIQFANRDFVMTGGCAKPIIYLYPTQETNLNVQVVPNGTLTFTYPEYKNGWDVTAFPNGHLTLNNQSYNYLWWESRTNSDLTNPESGFIVKKDDLNSFFDSKLASIGLKQNEINDFKEYWIDTMTKENSEYYQVSFLMNDEVNQIAKLNFSEKVDTLLRVFMLYKPVGSIATIPEQKLSKVDRLGFTVVEWGGAKL